MHTLRVIPLTFNTWCTRLTTVLFLQPDLSSMRPGPFFPLDLSCMRPGPFFPLDLSCMRPGPSSPAKPASPTLTLCPCKTFAAI
eukprot:1141041-Pelagomonas_calceolata.AAC.3